MAIKKTLLSILLPSVLLAGLTGCWHDEKDAGLELLDAGVEVVSTTGMQMFGRDIVIEALAFDGDTNNKARAVQVTADGAVISLLSTATPDATPMVHGGDINFGGHVLSVTNSANEFLLDGAPITLPPASRLMVTDGSPAAYF